MNDLAALCRSFLTDLVLDANRQHADQPIQHMLHGSCPLHGLTTLEMHQRAAQLAAHVPAESDRSHGPVSTAAARPGDIGHGYADLGF